MGAPERRDVRHVERDDPQPRLAIERVELEDVRDDGPQRAAVHAPVGEEQVVPRLRHQPRFVRHRPRTVVRHAQDGVVEVVLPDIHANDQRTPLLRRWTMSITRPPAHRIMAQL